MKPNVRIIGGLYRGKKLTFPDLPDLRPTPDRVKETLFNWLMYKVRNARCLDAFAGSGSLGFEAFSRGAKEVVLIESSRIVADSLHKNCDSFKTSQLKVIHEDIFVYLRKNSKPFDIIFLDPPFSSDNLQDCIDLMTNTSSLAPGGLLYIESPMAPNLEDPLFLLKSKRAGRVYYSLFEYKQSER